MILHDRKNKEDREQKASSAICGIRVDSIELDCDDIKELMSLPTENLRLWLESVSCRFRPNFAKPNIEIKPFDWGDIGKITKGVLEESQMNKHEFNKQFMCDFTPELKPLSEKEMNKLGIRFDETIKKRISKAGDSPILIIKSRLHIDFDKAEPGEDKTVTATLKNGSISID